MEISEDEVKDTEVNTNRKSDVCSESGGNEGIDNDEPDLKETLPSEDQGDPNYIVDDLYNHLYVEKDDYEF